jgi:hypothetical protein
MMKNSLIKLSPSSLNLFKECPRCFWLEKNKGIKRPRGIFPSLPGGMDLVIKDYFDKYRMIDKLPPEVDGKVSGKLFSNMAVLEKWRNWRTTELRYEDKVLNAILTGALDDCLISNDIYIPLDYKTRGSELKDDPRQYYQTQLDCYCLILESSGYKTEGLAYLLYYWPLEVKEDGLVRFHVEPIKIETNIDAAKKIFEDAINVLNREIPQASVECEYCNLVMNRKNE